MILVSLRLELVPVLNLYLVVSDPKLDPFLLLYLPPQPHYYILPETADEPAPGREYLRRVLSLPTGLYFNMSYGLIKEQLINFIMHLLRDSLFSISLDDILDLYCIFVQLQECLHLGGVGAHSLWYSEYCV